MSAKTKIGIRFFAASILAMLAGLFFVIDQPVRAIGQMTKPIVFGDVLRGQSVQETLTLYGEEKQASFGLTADGEIKDWVKFYLPHDLKNPITEIEIPARAQKNVIAQFSIPEDTANGTYHGEVAMLSMPGKEEKEQGVSVSVGLRIGREVSITVTDTQIINFHATIIPLKYGVGKGESLKIKVIYDNQGNVAIKPALQLKITQISTGNVVHNAIYPYPETENPIKPFERKVFENLIEWQTAGQENGRYRAEIKVLLNGAVMEEESFRFDVGVDIWTLLLGAISRLGGGNLTLAWFVIAGILLAVAGSLSLAHKTPRVLGLKLIENTLKIKSRNPKKRKRNGKKTVVNRVKLKPLAKNA